MAEYQLTAHEGIVHRIEDNAWIPDDPMNTDRIRYEQWLADGGVPDPYVEPEPSPPQPTMEQTVAFDHENRIRVLEGQPPLVMADFIDKMRGG